MIFHDLWHYHIHNEVRHVTVDTLLHGALLRTLLDLRYGHIHRLVHGALQALLRDEPHFFNDLLHDALDDLHLYHHLRNGKAHDLLYQQSASEERKYHRSAHQTVPAESLCQIAHTHESALRAPPRSPPRCVAGCTSEE